MTLANIYKIQIVIHQLDSALNHQLQSILHHPLFQQLESRWRALFLLVEDIPKEERTRVKIKVLSLSWQELSHDLLYASDFEQTNLFAKVYHQEFGQPGGEPFGLLLGDYYVNLNTNNKRYLLDLHTLKELSLVAAYTFAPFIMAIAPEFLDLHDFADLERYLQFEILAQQNVLQAYSKLRMQVHSKFIGLILPQFLIRAPYLYQNYSKSPLAGFEEVIKSVSDLLWGNSIYLFAAIVIEEFINTGWFTKIAGFKTETKNLLPYKKNYFFEDWGLQYAKISLNTLISEKTEKELQLLGLMIISENQYQGQLALTQSSMVYKAKRPSKFSSNIEKESSIKIQHLLCVCRFAHYIKILMRNKIGQFTSAQECQDYLNHWVHQYTADSSKLSKRYKILHPLAEAKIEVTASPYSESQLLCKMIFVPHHEFHSIAAELVLHTTL